MKIAIRNAIKNGAPAWVVDWKAPGGKRTRRFFQTKGAAEEFRSSIQTHGTRVGDFWRALTTKERDALVSLITVAREKGHSLVDAVQAISDGRFTSATMDGPKLPAVIVECLTAKRAANRRDGYVKDLGLVLGAFVRGREAVSIWDVTASDIEQWIAAKYTNMHSRATILNRVNTLFSFAVRRGYRPDNPCDRIERVTIEHVSPKILTPDEAVKLMVAIRAEFPRGLAWFSLGLFAGIRPEECDKLSWDAIDLVRGIVQIDAATAKVRQRRIVHLLPAAVAWLQLAKESGADLPLPNVSRRRMQRDVRGTMGWDAWPQDILRHTAASYWLASIQDAGKVAHELGNSAGILLRHYRELVSREDAARFWELRPSGEHPTRERGKPPTT